MGAQAVRLSNVDIDNALKNRDFEILFQPIFDLGNGALARMETFVRWRHPSLGLLPPGAFISFFESQGRMSELTRYVLSQALADYRDWRGASAPGFSINLALSDLSDEAFAPHFEVILRECGFPAELITLECPMPPVNAPIETAAAQFQRLADTGARLAIEVRGRANDFLRLVDPFPFDEIKTGGAAILRFARTVRGPGLTAISELLDIANKANAAITAVGVEDQASLSALRGLGFAAAQGNHLGRVGDLKSFTPARVNDVRALLGLEPLGQTDLHALFRTQAPAPQAAATAELTAPVAGRESNEALVERLAQRFSRRDDAAQEPVLDDAMTGRTREGPDRTAVRAAAKAAAIARIKRRAAAEAADVDPGAAPAAARGLQDRISREFGDSRAGAAAYPAGSPETDEFDLDAAVGGSENRAAALDSTADKELEPAAAAAKDETRAAEEAAPMSEPIEDVDGTGDADAREEPEISAGAEPPMRATLSVGAARAFFRPGLRVGITGPAPKPPRPQEVRGPQLRDGPTTQAEEMDANAQLAPALAPQTAARPNLSAAKGEARSALGDLARDDPDHVAEELAAAAAPASAAAAPRRRRRKTFLNRVVLPYPKYFWPRPIRRYLKRRKAEAERRVADAEGQGAQDAAE